VCTFETITPSLCMPEVPALSRVGLPCARTRKTIGILLNLW
jgi:hypothetical protein